MDKEEMFKKTLREEINFFRSQTKEEILKVLEEYDSGLES